MSLTFPLADEPEFDAKEKGRLLFAGEATMQDYRHTVHGAWFSGEREAQRIIDQIY